MSATPLICCDACGHMVPEDEAHLDEVIECDGCSAKRTAYQLRHAHPAPPASVAEYATAKGERVAA